MPDGRPALLGNLPDGSLAVLSSETQSLGAAWSLQGRTSLPGQWTFDLQLPPAPLKSLTLDLPRGWAPRVSAGVCRRMGDEPGGDPAVGGPVEATSPAPPAGEVDVVDHGRSRWQIELGGQSRVGLTVSDCGAVATPASSAPADERPLAARVGSDGGPGSTSPTSRCQVGIGSGSFVADRRPLGDRPVAFVELRRTTPAAAGAEQTARGLGRSCASALASPVLGRRWRLPALRERLLAGRSSVAAGATAAAEGHPLYDCRSLRRC